MPASPLNIWSAVSWPSYLCALAHAPGGIIAICKLIPRAPTDCLEIPGAHRYPCFPTNSGLALTIWQVDVTSSIMLHTRWPSASGLSNCPRRLGSVTRIGAGLDWNCISRACQSAIAHGVIDLTTAQTDIGQNVIVTLLKGSGNVPRVQLVS